MKKSEEYFHVFRNSHKLKNWLAYFSVLTWEEANKYKKYPSIFSRGEVSINELFISKIIEAILEYNLPIRIFHANDETTNGNDFEILIPYNSKEYVLFPCQAKKLYKNNRYTAITHPVKDKKTGAKREQITYLLDYAKKVGGFPLYLLYNHTTKDFNPKIYTEYTKFNPELFGCTMVSAFYLLDNFLQKNQRLKQISFDDIHPPASPLIQLAQLYRRNFIATKEILSVFGTIRYKKHEKALSKLKGYTLNYLINEKIVDKEWVEIHPTDKKRFVGINAKSLMGQTIVDETASFSPKYRIILTSEIIMAENRYNSYL